MTPAQLALESFGESSSSIRSAICQKGQAKHSKTIQSTKDTERNLWFYMEPYTLRLLRFGRAHSPLPRMYGGSYRPRVEMEREGVRESEREIRENPIARTKERKILENCLTKQ